jgi:hypothetical protein
MTKYKCFKSQLYYDDELTTCIKIWALKCCTSLLIKSPICVPAASPSLCLTYTLFCVRMLRTLCTLGAARRAERNGLWMEMKMWHMHLCRNKRARGCGPRTRKLPPLAHESGHSTQFTQHSSAPSALIVTFAARRAAPAAGSNLRKVCVCVCVCAGAASAFWHNRFRRMGFGRFFWGQGGESAPARHCFLYF